MRRLIVAAALALAAGGMTTQAAPAQAGVPWLVTFHVESVSGVVGHSFRFTGKVTPRARAAGLKVVLQQKRAGSDKPWRGVATGRISGRGDYLVRERPSTNTIRRYRVVMPATAAHARGVSAVRTLKVYAWSNLTLRPPVNESNFEPVASVSMGGVEYPASLEAKSSLNPDVPTTGTVEFNLDRMCMQFRGTFGLSDNSEVSDDPDYSAEAWLAASADGVEFYRGALALGHKAFYGANYFPTSTPPVTVRFDTESIWDSPGQLDGLGAVGTPQVLCTR